MKLKNDFGNLKKLGSEFLLVTADVQTTLPFLFCTKFFRRFNHQRHVQTKMIKSKIRF
jgi:hypothetical protein